MSAPRRHPTRFRTGLHPGVKPRPQTLVDDFGNGGRLFDIPRNPVLDDYCGTTIGANLDHQLARAVFMETFLGAEWVEEFLDRLAVETGLSDTLAKAVDALAGFAARLGLESRAGLFFGEVPDDARITEGEWSAVAGYFEAKVERRAATTELLRRFVVGAGIVWPWVEAELLLAFQVGLDSVLLDRPTFIALRGGPTRPIVADELEVASFSVAPGEPVADALERLHRHEQTMSETRQRLEAQQRPAMAMGRIRDKSRATLARDVGWFVRHELFHETIASIAREEFGDGADDRRKDVRLGIRRAHAVLDLTSFRYDSSGVSIEPREPLAAGVVEQVPLEPPTVMDWVATTDDTSTLTDLSFALALEGRAEDALRAADRALAIDPGAVAARINRANALRILGRADEALAEAEASLAEWPEHVGALHGRAAALRQLGRTVEAVEALAYELDLRASHAEDPVLSSHSFVDRGRLHVQLGDFEGAERDFDAACAAWPDSPEAFGARGGYRRARGDLDGALLDLRTVARLNPEDPSAFNDLGVVLSDLHRYALASVAFDRALAIQPEYSAAFVNRGVMFEAQGRRRKAAEAFRRAVEADPNNPYAHGNLAVSLLASSRLDEALVHASSAAERGDEFPGASGTLGAVLLQLGRPQEAVPHFEHAVQLDERSRPSLHGLAIAYAKAGDLDRAMGAIAILLARFPDAVDAVADDDDLKRLSESAVHSRLLEGLTQRPDGADRPTRASSRTGPSDR